jgi:2-phospho-L-lactate guanylyltransferase
MSERIVAVVPLRSFRNGKTRLASVLSREERESLVRRSALGVITAARDSGVVETVIVISPDADAVEWASQLGPGVVSLEQPETMPGLNGAIAAGREWAMRRGAKTLLSLFADLPWLSADDLRDMAARREAVVLGPDRRNEGTNALLLRLTGAGQRFRFAFGHDSLTHHREEARRLGLPVAIHEARGIGFDLDTPLDWADFLAATAGERCAERPPVSPCALGAA